VSVIEQSLLQSNLAYNMSALKRRKTYYFNEKWELDYFCIMINENCTCLICNASLALPKKGNLERHFMTRHAKYNADYPLGSEARKMKVNDLKSNVHGQQRGLKKFCTSSRATTIASFKASFFLAKKGKVFSEGELLQECFLDISDSLFQDFRNKREIKSAIKELQLSRDTVMRRIEKMSEDVAHQLCNDFNTCACFSLQLDESTDIRDAVQVIVFIRMAFHDWSIKEEVLGIITLKERTRGIDIFNAFKSYCFEIKLPLWKLVSVTTDGARSMVGSVNGFIALCEKDDDFPDFLKYHCIIHQQVVCSKRLNTKEVMDIAFKIANSVGAKPLRRRLFRQEFEGQELLLHTDVRWLSSGKFLQRFRDLLQEIKAFLQNRGDNYAKLNDLVWMSDLAFLADFTGRLSALNLQLQGKSKPLIELISAIGAFKMQIPALISDLEEKRFEFFPNIKDHLQNHPVSIWNPEKYVAEVNMISDDFDVRFRDFQKIEEIVAYVSYPFKSDLNVSSVSHQISQVFSLERGAVEMEMLALKADVFLKARSCENDFWRVVGTKYCNIKKCAEYIHSCFGSTYLCESAFSFMNVIKTKHSAVLTDDDHLGDCLKLSLTGYTPKYEKLVNSVMTQTSH